MLCRLCGSDRTRLERIGDLKYWFCGECGYIAVDRRFFPSRAEEEARYRLHRNNPEEPGYRSFLASFVERSLTPFLKRNDSVLDFGSGPTKALSILLVERGYRAEAYDPFFAPGGTWRRRRWQAIVLHEVAEHLRQPGRTIAALTRRLAPGGILAFRTRFAPARLDEFKHWWYRQDLTHLGFYSPASFCRLSAALSLQLAVLEEPDIAVIRAPDPEMLLTRQLESCHRIEKGLSPTALF